MANGNYKFIFMGALRNSIILSFLCNISSTEAPGIESSGSKGNSHHAQIKVSSMISQHEHFSVKHFLSAGGVHCNTGKRWFSKYKEDCIIVLVKFVVEVMAPLVINPPLICSHHLQGYSRENWQSCGTHFLRNLLGTIKFLNTLRLHVLEWIHPGDTKKATFSAAGSKLARKITLNLLKSNISTTFSSLLGWKVIGTFQLFHIFISFPMYWLLNVLCYSFISSIFSDKNSCLPSSLIVVENQWISCKWCSVNTVDIANQELSFWIRKVKNSYY